MDNKRIFCFWEPLNRMPGYLQLCIETWRRWLPDFEIVLLDYTNIGKWIPEDVLDLKWLRCHYSLPVQADAFRIALLHLYGGVWLDVDTVIVSEKARDIICGADKLTMIGSHVACLSAPIRDPFVARWYARINRRIEWHKWYEGRVSFLARGMQILKRRHRFGPGPIPFEKWDYFGNGILRRLLLKHRDEYKSLDRLELKAFPEICATPNSNEGVGYVQFYSDKKYCDAVVGIVKSGGGIVLLHNSWTPKWIRRLDRKSFLALDVPLSRMLSFALSS